MFNIFDRSYQYFFEPPQIDEELRIFGKQSVISSVRSVDALSPTMTSIASAPP